MILAHMLVPSLLIFLSFVVLFVGAEFLVRGGAGLALRLGLSPLVVGLTVVAYGTSMPELLVSLKAAFSGQPDIALGNVVGSNIFNIAVILGLSAIVFPVATNLQVIKWDAPLLLAVTVLSTLTFIDGQVSRVEGIVFVCGAIACTVWTVWAAKKEPKVASEAEEVAAPSGGSLTGDVFKIIIGLGVLILGSRLLVDNAVTVASSLGVSEAVIGLTIIAAGTSMPELATSVVAAWRRQSDIALGNVLGSNLFNILFVLGGSSIIHPVSTKGMTMLDLGMMIGVTALLLPILITGKRINRIEGLLLFISYIAYLFFLWPK